MMWTTSKDRSLCGEFMRKATGTWRMRSQREPRSRTCWGVLGLSYCPSGRNKEDVCGAVNNSDMHTYPCHTTHPSSLTSREAKVLFQADVSRLNEAVPESPVMYFCLNCCSPQFTRRRTSFPVLGEWWFLPEAAICLVTVYTNLWSNSALRKNIAKCI